MSQGVLLTVLLGAGAVQALFLGSALFFGRSGNRRLGLLVAALLVIFSLAIFAQVLQNALPPNLALLIAFVNINTELTIGPVYYLIVRSLVRPQRELRPVDLLHLLPFIVGLIVWGSAWFSVVDHQRLIRFGFDTEFPVLEFLLFKAVILYSYLIAACRLLVRAARASRLLYAGRHRVDPKIVLRVSIVLACIPGFIYVVAAFDHLGYELNSDPIGGLLLVGVIFSAAWILMFRPWVLSLQAEDADSRRWSGSAEVLRDYLDRERPWLDPDLKSSDVATRMDWTESSLAQVVKHGMNTSFRGLLNRYRLAEFERLATDSDSQDRDILELAFDAGFGSKAAFYRAFRDTHGTTPTQYRRSLLSALTRKASRFSN